MLHKYILLIRTELHQYFFFILFYASSFLYAFPFSPFFRVIGLGCIQSASTCTESIVMIYYFKNPHGKKSRTGLECYEVLGPKNPLPFIFSLMPGLTRPQSFSLIGRAFVLKTQKPHAHTYTHICIPTLPRSYPLCISKRINLLHNE